MKKLFLFSMLSGTLTLSAGTPVLIDGFETGTIDGWGGYKDAKSPAPVLSLTDDALGGNAALKVTFGGCAQYQGIHYFKAPVLPEKATAVSFLVKPVTGAPPTTFVLSERKERYGKDFATGVIPLKLSGNDWQKVTLNLADMKYGSGPERGKPFPLKAGAVYAIRFYGAVSDRPAVFLLDDLAWETE